MGEKGENRGITLPGMKYFFRKVGVGRMTGILSKPASKATP